MNVNDATFKEVPAAPLAIVDFWSPSCPYCVQFKPIFQAAAAQYDGQILMVEADVNEAPKSAGAYGVESLPTLVFMKNGQVVNKIEGAMSAQDFQAEIANFLGTPGAGAPMASGKGASVLGALALAGLLAGTGYLVYKSL